MYVHSIRFMTWAEFVRKLPVSRATADRWYLLGKLKVQVFQPHGPGGRRFVAFEEAERVLREMALAKVAESEAKAGVAQARAEVAPVKATPAPAKPRVLVNEQRRPARGRSRAG